MKENEAKVGIHCGAELPAPVDEFGALRRESIPATKEGDEEGLWGKYGLT